MRVDQPKYETIKVVSCSTFLKMNTYVYGMARMILWDSFLLSFFLSSASKFEAEKKQLMSDMESQEQQHQPAINSLKEQHEAATNSMKEKHEADFNSLKKEAESEREK